MNKVRCIYNTKYTSRLTLNKIYDTVSNDLDDSVTTVVDDNGTLIVGIMKTNNQDLLSLPLPIFEDATADFREIILNNILNE